VSLFYAWLLFSFQRTRSCLLFVSFVGDLDIITGIEAERQCFFKSFFRKADWAFLRIQEYRRAQAGGPEARMLKGWTKEIRFRFRCQG
uniref:hypothetical protein n=1 Tax=Shouchella shacheensis TaxID=1649580 RepID=UPI001C597865